MPRTQACRLLFIAVMQSQKDEVDDQLRKNAAERLLAEKLLVATESALLRPSLSATRTLQLRTALRAARTRLLKLREERQALTATKAHTAMRA